LYSIFLGRVEGKPPGCHSSLFYGRCFSAWQQQQA
jgi:hypothetical protein